jgi:hypothetical protein
LFVDASKIGRGAWLAHPNEKNESQMQPILFISKIHSASQRNYSATKLETHALVWALNHLEHYLSCSKFTVVTDHKALQYIFTQKVMSPMLIEWYNTIMKFNFDIIHRPGMLNVVADALSRPMDEPNLLLLNSTTQEPITYSELKGKTIPKAEERIDLIEKTHLEGHIAAQGIVYKLYNHGYWWPDMRGQIDEVIGSCNACAKYNIVSSIETN